MIDVTTMYAFTRVQYDHIRDEEILKDELWNKVKTVIEHSSDWDMVSILIESHSSTGSAKK